MGLAAFSSMTLKDESRLRQIDKPLTLDGKGREVRCMSIDTIFYGLKAGKLSKPTFKLSKLAQCERI